MNEVEIFLAVSVSVVVMGLAGLSTWLYLTQSKVLPPIFPAALGLGLLALVAIFLGLDARNVNRIGRWFQPPPILITSSAFVSVQQADEAVEWWTRRGYEFGPILRTDLLPEPVTGSIVIRATPSPQPPNHLGYTNVGVTDGGMIQHSVVSMPYDWYQQEPNALTHELGHALGLLHHNRVGSMMHKRASDGGSNDQGLFAP